MKPIQVLVAWLVVATAGACATPERTSREPAPGEPHVSILTYNVNYGLAGDPAAVAAIREADADIVCLQETTPAWEAHLRRALADRYPHSGFRHSRGAGGLGFLAKRPFAERAFIPPTAGWFPAWLVRAETPLGPLDVLNVHLRPPLTENGSIVPGYLATPAVREREVEALLPHLAPDVPAVLAGDFNEDEDGDALERLALAGFRSALPEHDAGADTWRWATSLGELSLRLDHVVYDARRLEPLSARVVRAGRSDHFPVHAVLVAAAARRDDRSD